MVKKDSDINNPSPGKNMPNMTKDILKDFNESVKSMVNTRKSLERDIDTLRNEIEALKRDKALIDTDIGKTKEVSEIAMAAKAAEEEKQDALKRNHELRSYLDSAADTIKDLRIRLAQVNNEVKRLNSRINTLEGEKLSIFEEKEKLHVRTVRMEDMIREQDLKIKELSIKLETQQDEKTVFEAELEATRKTLDEIQKSMITVNDKVKKTFADAGGL